jgi:hypothetical protein
MEMDGQREKTASKRENPLSLGHVMDITGKHPANLQQRESQRIPTGVWANTPRLAYRANRGLQPEQMDRYPFVEASRITPWLVDFQED